MQSLKRIAVFLLAFIMALQVIISPSYADWEVSGGGNGSSGVAGDGTYVDDMQGLRITIIDKYGNPAFSFGTEPRYTGLDVLYTSRNFSMIDISYGGCKALGTDPSMYLNNGQDLYSQLSGMKSGIRSNISMFSWIIDTINKKEYYFRAPNAGGAMSNYTKLSKITPIEYDSSSWQLQGETIRELIYGDAKKSEPKEDAALYVMFNLFYASTDTPIWRLTPAAISANGIPQDIVNAYHSGKADSQGDKYTAVGLMQMYNFAIVVEPIIWATLRNTETQYSKYTLYGTPTNIAEGINRLVAEEKWTSGSYQKGGYDQSLFRASRHSMVLSRNITYGEKTYTVPAKATDASYKPTNTDLLSAGKTNGWAMHIYICGTEEKPTHTWDNHNFPIDDPVNQGNNPKYKEHPAPDPTVDNCTSSAVKKNTSLAHYRIVKVYDQEVIYVHSDGFGNITFEEGIQHVTTQVREKTVPDIRIDNELPEYELIAWKYTYDPYTECKEDTEWESDQIATKTVVKEGETTATVDIADPNDKNKETTLYVRLIKRMEEYDTSTWDEDNYPDGEPAKAPDPPPVPQIKYVYDDPDMTITPEDHLDNKYKIVKVYEYREYETGTDPELAEWQHRGTYYEDENPSKILIENEPDYKLTEWYISGDDPSESDTNHLDSWEKTKTTYSDVKRSGKYPGMVELKSENKEKTLFLLLRKEKEIEPPPTHNPAEEDLTESQLTKISSTDSVQFGWSGYTFNAKLAAAVKQHVYTLHLGCTHSCSSEHCSHSCDGHCGDKPAVCSHMSRVYGDHSVHATFGVLTKDPHETREVNSGAHKDFEGTMYGKGGQLSETIQFIEESLSDGSYDWTLNSKGESKDGIEYITTLSRASIQDYVHLAKYKKDAMDATSYTRVNTIFPEAYQPVNKRKANNIYNQTIKYKIGHKGSVDSIAISQCIACCPKHHVTASNTKIVTYDKTFIELFGNFDIYVYGGEEPKVANSKPTNLTGFNVAIGSANTKHSALYVSPQTSNIVFYPYIKMSYQITKDNISFPGYKADPSTANSRTVYMLSDKKSTILPTNSVEVSWVNEAQNNGKYGLQMTSTQWSTHSKATSGSGGWQGKNQVLPGGALYELSTTGTESYIKIVTYNTLVDDESRKWITVSDPSKYTSASIAKSNENFLKEAKNVIENYRVVEWVTTNISAETAWKDESTAVKLMLGGESLSNLKLPTKASNDAKYVLYDGTEKNEKGAAEADLDIVGENYQTIVYKAFSDVNGDIYVAQLAKNTNGVMIDQAGIDEMIELLNQITGTTLNKNTLPGISGDMTYTINKIGTKKETTTQIINNLKNNTKYSALYQLDLKTKYITNTIDSVLRNRGSDTLNATWTTDGRWYNEAFDGVYEVVQTTTLKVGLGIPNRRVRVLDPMVCPAKSSTSDMYTKAHMSQFCLDSKSSVARDEEDGYLGTFEDVKVYMPDLTTMLYSRKFYIPNANVQDLS